MKMMFGKYFTDLKNFAILAGVILSVLGVFGGLLSLCDKWKNRKPNLELFAPYQWSGIDTGAQKRFSCLYLRIANSSRKSAYLYLETMSVMVKINGEWYTTYFIDQEIKQTDFPEAEKLRFGLGKAHFLNRFEDNIITFDKPLCGYVVLGHDNDAIFNNDIDEIKIEVEDCHREKYKLRANLKEQSKRDPYRKYLESLDERKRN
jgi:hypothetical protein